MKSLTLMLSLLFSVFTLNTFSQQLTGDKLLKLELHASGEDIVIAKFYDRETRKITEQWEMRTRVADINSGNFNTLLEKGSIYAEGKCYSFYTNGKVQTESNFQSGKKTGIQKAFFKSGELMMETDMNLFPNNVFTYYYKNGEIRKTESNLGLPVDWTEKTYYENGHLRSEVNFKRKYIDGKYRSFYPDGLKKRKAEFNNGTLISDKCFDKQEKKTTCDDFIKAPEYPGSWQVFEKDLERIDFGFNKTYSDTCALKLLLKIDTLGNTTLENYFNEHADSLKLMLNKWVKSLKRFSPAKVDDFPEDSYLSITLALSNDQIVWSGEPYTGITKANNGFDSEKKWLWYCDYPLPKKDEIIIEGIPEFPGGEKSLRSFISNCLHYPKQAQKEKIEGMVFVSFIVKEDGSVSDITIKKGVHPLLDQEALRVVGLMPKWKPATIKGEALSVPFTIPINFKLH